MSIEKLGFGCAKLGSLSGASETVADSLLKTAYDLGIDFFDTANIYGQGDSERLLGKFLKSTGARVVVATKAGYMIPNEWNSPAVFWFKPVLRLMMRSFPFFKKQVMQIRSSNSQEQDFSIEGLTNSIYESLNRLGRDQLDVLFLHNPSKEDLKDGNIFEILSEIRNSGLSKKWGISLSNVEDTRYITPRVEIDVIQVELNLLSGYQDFASLSEFRSYRKIEILVNRPFSGGQIVRNNIERNSRIAVLEEMSRTHQESVRAMALKFLIYHTPIDKVLVGITKKEQLLDITRIAEEGPMPRRIVADIVRLLEDEQ